MMVFFFLCSTLLASPQLAERHLHIGLKLLAQNRHRDASAALRAALALAPGRADILEAISQAEGATPQPAAAASPSPRTETFTAATASPSPRTETFTAAAASPSPRTETFTAAALADSELKKAKIAAELEQARQAYRSSEIHQARDAWNRALQLDQDNAEAQQGLTRLEQEIYRSDLDAPFDSSVQNLYEAALREVRKDRLVEAQSKLQEALALNPHQAQVKMLLAQIQTGAFTQADSRKMEAHVVEAARLLEAGDLAASRRLYEKVLHQNPSEQRAEEGLRLLRPKISAEVKSLILRAAKVADEQALALYQKALDLDPSHEAARKGVQLLAGRLEHTRQSAAFKDRLRQIYNQGVEAWQSGNLAAAAARFHEVLKLSPHDKDAERALKKVEERLASSADRNQADAIQLLKEAGDFERQGRLQEALQAYERAAARDQQNAEAKQGAERVRREISEK